MTEKKKIFEDTAALRQRAEDLLKSRSLAMPEDIAALSPEDIRKTLYELSVHQVELEMQNEALRAAQVELEKSQARYFDLYDLAPVGYCTLSEQGLILEANLTAATLLGMARNALVKEPISRFIFNEDQDIYYLHRKQLFETGEPQECELRLVKPDGARFWAHLKSTTAQAEDGAPLCRMTLSDITGRKQAEEALRESEKKYRSILETIEEGYFEVDLSGNFTFFNDSMCRTLGYSSNELMGMNNRAFMDTENAQKVYNAFNQVFTSGQPLKNFDWELITKDGEKCYVDTSVSLIKNANGEAIGFRGIERDVTECKHAEKALRESEEKFRLMAENMSDVITMMDMNFQFTYVSPSIKHLTGFSVEKALQFSIQDIIPPDSFQQILNIIEEEITAEAAGKNDPDRSRIIEYQQYRKDKSIIWVESNCRFLRDRDQKPRGFLVISRDITERKHAETLQAQLTQAQKLESVGRLAGGVAHDFNNMLGVILGHTELALLKADENHDLNSDLKEIQKAATRSADLTKQLLAFARKQTISPRRLDLNDTVESMLNMLRRLIGEDIDLVWKPAPHLWPVKMDPSQIDQILANLCINARDAISDVGKLTIETGRKSFDVEYCRDHPGFIPGDFVLLAVSDNGCGMNKATLDNLFEPFFTTKEVGKGTGLGLATVYGIVKQNNGFINVYSEPGHGSTFKIYLPRLVVDEDTDKAVPQKKIAAGGTETILLVEDEPSILRMTRMMLERKGYSVLSAATPAEAVEKAKNHSGAIDLLMTDVVMPEMNGRDLAGKITALCPGIKLLFMSGYTADIIAHQGVLDDGVAFIQKPFSMADLAEKLREVLDSDSDKTQG